MADIFISGNIGLVKHDYDQTAVVTPRLTASLPLAGALAGGPAVGAALFLADKLFGSTVNKITEIHYEIKGSWENPTITRVKTTGWPTPAEK